MLLGSEAEYLVADLDHRITIGHDGTVPAEDRNDPDVDAWNVATQVLELTANQRAAAVGSNRDQAHATVREIEHLQGLRKLDQLNDIVGQHLLGADRQVDIESLRTKHLLVVQKISRADPRNATRNVEHSRRHLAGHEVRFVRLRDRDQKIGVCRTGLG